MRRSQKKQNEEKNTLDAIVTFLLNKSEDQFVAEVLAVEERKGDIKVGNWGQTVCSLFSVHLLHFDIAHRQVS